MPLSITVSKASAYPSSLVESATANFTSTPASWARRSAVISAVGEMSKPVTSYPFLAR